MDHRKQVRDGLFEKRMVRAAWGDLSTRTTELVPQKRRNAGSIVTPSDIWLTNHDASHPTSSKKHAARIYHTTI